MPASPNILVCGATFAAFGLASRYRDKVLVVDRTTTVGNEFTSTFHPGTRWHETPLSPIGQAFKDDLIKRNILTEDGRAHIPALTPVLSHHIVQQGINCLLATEILSVEQSDAGFEVMLFGASGSRRLTVAQIVDTTAGRLSQPGVQPEILSKSIHAILNCAEDQPVFPDITCAGATFVQGRFPSEVYLQLALRPQDDWPSARAKLHAFWADRPEALAGWTLAAVAFAFHTRIAPGSVPIAPGWQWLPSAAYDNPLAAFEAGHALRVEG